MRAEIITHCFSAIVVNKRRMNELTSAPNLSDRAWLAVRSLARLMKASIAGEGAQRPSTPHRLLEWNSVALWAWLAGVLHRIACQRGPGGLLERLSFAPLALEKLAKQDPAV